MNFDNILISVTFTTCDSLRTLYRQHRTSEWVFVAQRRKQKIKQFSCPIKESWACCLRLPSVQFDPCGSTRFAVCRGSSQSTEVYRLTGLAHRKSFTDRSSWARLAVLTKSTAVLFESFMMMLESRSQCSNLLT